MRNIAQDIQSRYSIFDNILTKFWESWLTSSLTFKRHLQTVKWRNQKASPGTAYLPTEVEKLANVITHAIWILPAILAAIKLFEKSETSRQLIVSWVYGGALIMLFIVSTFFHCSCYCTQQLSLRNILHRCDRAMIYVFIAASYFPWLQLEKSLNFSSVFCMKWTIWILAGFGITYQQIFHERFKCLETCFYILMGMGPAFAVMLSGKEFNGLFELKLGGFFYIVGICFFKCDGILPMAHAIWHLFVVLAASLHYNAILVNLYPRE